MTLHLMSSLASGGAMKGIKMNAKQRAAVYVVAGAVMAILIGEN